MKTDATRTLESSALPDWTEIVLSKARSIRFGSILITIHEGRVIQIESSEKVRLPSRDAPSSHHG